MKVKIETLERDDRIVLGDKHYWVQKVTREDSQLFGGVVFLTLLYAGDVGDEVEVK